MRVAYLAVIAIVLLAGCAWLPKPPAHFTLMLPPAAPVHERAPTAGVALHIVDIRRAADPLRIGEVHAPAGVRAEKST